jgi:hypothetical protein
MVDKPIQKALEGGIEKTKQETKNLCPWLEDPYRCDSCNSYCDATEDFVESQALVMDIWKCPECGDRYYRNRD